MTSNSDLNLELVMGIEGLLLIIECVLHACQCHAFEELFVMEPYPSKNDDGESGSGECPTNEKSLKDGRGGFLLVCCSLCLYRSNVSLVPEGGVGTRGGLGFVAVFVVGFDLRGRHGCGLVVNRKRIFVFLQKAERVSF